MVSLIGSLKENSLRTSVYIYGGDNSPQNDKAACFSIVSVLAGGYSCHTTTWRNKVVVCFLLNKKVKDRLIEVGKLLWS